MVEIFLDTAPGICGGRDASPTRGEAPVGLAYHKARIQELYEYIRTCIGVLQSSRLYTFTMPIYSRCNTSTHYSCNMYTQMTKQNCLTRHAAPRTGPSTVHCAWSMVDARVAGVNTKDCQVSSCVKTQTTMIRTQCEARR